MTQDDHRAEVSNVIDLDQILERHRKTLALGGLKFTNRPVAWADTIEFDALQSQPMEQHDLLIRIMRERCDTPEDMTSEWIHEHVNMDTRNLLIAAFLGGTSTRELLRMASDGQTFDTPQQATAALSRAERRAMERQAGKASPKPKPKPRK